MTSKAPQISLVEKLDLIPANLAIGNLSWTLTIRTLSDMIKLVPLYMLLSQAHSVVQRLLLPTKLTSPEP